MVPNEGHGSKRCNSLKIHVRFARKILNHCYDAVFDSGSIPHPRRNHPPLIRVSRCHWEWLDSLSFSLHQLLLSALRLCMLAFRTESHGETPLFRNGVRCGFHIEALVLQAHGEGPSEGGVHYEVNACWAQSDCCLCGQSILWYGKSLGAPAFGSEMLMADSEPCDNRAEQKKWIALATAKWVYESILIMTRTLPWSSLCRILQVLIM